MTEQCQKTTGIPKRRIQQRVGKGTGRIRNLQDANAAGKEHGACQVLPAGDPGIPGELNKTTWDEVLGEVKGEVKGEGRRDTKREVSGETGAQSAKDLREEIPVFVPDASFREAYLTSMSAVLASGQYSNFGPMEERFAKKLSEVTGVPYCLPVASGDMALYLALLYFRLSGKYGGGSIREGETERIEVITTPFTFPSTAEAILRAGFRPVFADVDSETLTLSPKAIRRALSPRTVGVLPVHVYGMVCDTEAIQRIADEKNLFVLYDAAHAFGVQIAGRSVLGEGNLSAISTHATKTLHTMEGGCLFGRDKKVMHELRQMANFGLSEREGAPVEILGCNAKMNELEAAIGLVNLEHYEAGRKKRQALDKRYRENLSGIPGIRLLTPQEGVEGSFPYFPVFVGEESGITRDELREVLQMHGIRARRYFAPLVNESPVIRKLAGLPALPAGKSNETAKEKTQREHLLQQETPAALAASEEVLCLPFFNDLSHAQVDRICQVIREAVPGRWAG